MPPSLHPAQLDNLTASPSGYNGAYNRRYSSSTGLTPVMSPSVPAAALGLGSASPPPLSHGTMSSNAANIAAAAAASSGGAGVSPTLAPKDKETHHLATAVNVVGASLYPQRVILTTHPGQPGIRPLPMQWGASDPKIRGPVVASRHPSR